MVSGSLCPFYLGSTLALIKSNNKVSVCEYIFFCPYKYLNVPNDLLYQETLHHWPNIVYLLIRVGLILQITWKKVWLNNIRFTTFSTSTRKVDWGSNFLVLNVPYSTSCLPVIYLPFLPVIYWIVLPLIYLSLSSYSSNYFYQFLFESFTSSYCHIVWVCYCSVYFVTCQWYCPSGTNKNKSPFHSLSFWNRCIDRLPQVFCHGFEYL